MVAGEFLINQVYSRGSLGQINHKATELYLVDEKFIINSLNTNGYLKEKCILINSGKIDSYWEPNSMLSSKSIMLL